MSFWEEWGKWALVIVLGLVGLWGCNRIVATGTAGTGSSVGIVTTVEHFDHAVFFDDYDLLWFRASDATSQTDCYALAADQVEKAKQYAESKAVVTINFVNHRFWSWRGKCSQDTVIGFR